MYSFFEGYPTTREIIFFFWFCEVCFSFFHDLSSIALRDLESIVILFSSYICPVLDDLSEVFSDFYLTSDFFETFSLKCFFGILSCLDSSSGEFMIVVFSDIEKWDILFFIIEYCTSSITSSILFSFERFWISDDFKWRHTYRVMRNSRTFSRGFIWR